MTRYYAEDNSKKGREGEIEFLRNFKTEYELTYGPGNYIPPVAVAYWSFRIMVGAGFAMIGLAFYALFLTMGDIFNPRSRMLRFFVWAMILPYLANSAGWLLTEMGRAPWVVFGLLRLEDAVSTTVSAGMVLTSLIGFTLVYGALMAADVYLLAKYARAGPESGEAAEVPLPMEPSLLAAD